MKVGVLKEIKVKENRVAMTPAGVLAMSASGHQVLIEKGAGVGAGFPDDDYTAAGRRWPRPTRSSPNAGWSCM